MANMIPISTVTVGSGGASNIAFNNIPQIYTDLLVKISIRTDRSGTVGDGINLTFNNSSTAVYSDKALRGDGTSTSTFSDTNATSLYGSRAATAGITTSVFSNIEFYIPNYTGSNNKSVSIDGVMENNGTTAYTELISGIWTNSAPITSINIAGSIGTIQQYSSATLYGIRKY